MQLTQVAVAQDVDEGVHVGLGGEVDARAHVAKRRVDVLRVRGAQPVQCLAVLLYFVALRSRLLRSQHPCRQQVTEYSCSR